MEVNCRMGIDKLDIKEIESLTKEESEIDIKNLREDLSILFEQEDKGMKNARKLPYSEHWMKHWGKKIAEQYLFFYKLGMKSEIKLKQKQADKK